MIDSELIDACTHCGFCLPTCPTYGPLGQMEADSPRGRIWLMKGLADGTMTANSAVVEHIDRCLGCMACVTACPSGVRYDLLIEQTREVVEEQYDRPAGDWLLRTLVFSVFPHRRRLRVALALAPLGRRDARSVYARFGISRHPGAAQGQSPRGLSLGRARARVGLLTGCVQSVVFGDVNAATARVLAAEGYEVVTPPNQACCGALHLHAGRREEGKRRARAVAERFARRRRDRRQRRGLRVASQGRGARRARRRRLRATWRRSREPSGIRSSCASPSRTRATSRTRRGSASSRAMLLDAIPGLERVEPAEQAICCGSAGIYNLTQPDAARELGDRKAGHVLATEPDAYASANPGCLVQVSAALRRAGRPLPALHPIELVDASIRGVAAEELLAAARR